MNLDPTIVTALCKTIEKSIQWALKYDPGSQAALLPLAGKVLSVESTQPNIQLHFVCHPTNLEVLSYYEATPSCKIQGPLSNLIELLWSEQDSLANSGVVLSGEIGFLLQLKKLISNLDIDWEEPITDCLGDSIGHTLATLIRSKAQWAQSRAKILPSWIHDYLVDELRTTPAQAELGQYYKDVDAVRSQTDRLQAKIHQLKFTMAQKSSPTQSGQ